MYRFRLIGENIKLAPMPKILNRVNFETVRIGVRRCRELCIKVRVILERQTFRVVLETAEVPQNLLKAWTVTELI